MLPRLRVNCTRLPLAEAVKISLPRVRDNISEADFFLYKWNRKVKPTLVLGNAPTSADVPASVFDQTGVYFLVLTRAELSTDTDGLAVGSGAMAGVGTVFAFWVE